MADHNSVNVVCPFYLDEEQKTIQCEGIGGARSLRLAFASGRDKREYERRFCMELEECESCPVHRILKEKYA